jgi:alpha-L-arabinofuranosidase
MENEVKLKEIQISKDEQNELDEAIDFSLAALPLEDAENNLMMKIIEAPTKEELQRQLDLFNINQSKKNALRIIKLNNLLTKVEDQAIVRFEKRPDQVSNKELLEYMNVVSNQIERAQKSVDSLKDTPAIHITNQQNELNINVGPKLDRDSKERVMDVISALLKQVQKEPAVIEAEIIETGKEMYETSDIEVDTQEEEVFDKLTDEEN